jgi:hypothetical protein
MAKNRNNSRDFYKTSQPFSVNMGLNAGPEIRPDQTKVDFFNMQILSKAGPLSPTNKFEQMHTHIVRPRRQIGATLRPFEKASNGQLKLMKAFITSNNFA